MDLKLFHKVADVRLDRHVADPKPPAELFVAHPLDGQPSDLTLPCGQVCGRLNSAVWGRIPPPRPPGEGMISCLAFSNPTLLAAVD